MLFSAGLWHGDECALGSGVHISLCNELEPLFDPVHPVQAYAACAFLVIASGLLLGMGRRRRAGDTAGIALMAIGVAVYLTESSVTPRAAVRSLAACSTARNWFRSAL